MCVCVCVHVAAVKPPGRRIMPNFCISFCFDYFKITEKAFQYTTVLEVRLLTVLYTGEFILFIFFFLFISLQ